jgi:hypothetical protein
VSTVLESQKAKNDRRIGYQKRAQAGNKFGLGAVVGLGNPQEFALGQLGGLQPLGGH